VSTAGNDDKSPLIDLIRCVVCNETMKLEKASATLKTALEAWGAKSNLFHQGVAKEVDDPDVTAATMRKPGVILKRPTRIK
jgi:hypothetical protein